MNKAKKSGNQALKDIIMFLINSVKKNFITKIIFFALSLVLWFYINLQKDFETILNIPINIANIQKGKTLLNPIPSHVRMKIRSKGKALLMSDFNNEIFLEIDASGFADSVNVRLSTDQFVNTSNKDIDPVSIYQPVELIIQFDRLEIKKVPVVLNAEIDLKSGYLKTGKYTQQPESVLVSGPEAKVKNIKEIESVKIVKKDLDKDFSEKISLLLQDSASIKYSSKTVSVFQMIVRKGVTTFKTPVQILNKSDKINLIIDPVAIDINVTGPVNELHMISSGDFIVTADVSKLDKASNKIPLKIKSEIKLEWESEINEVKAIQY
ncbi:TPA: hypothetical protein DCR49_06375 [Candidatus Delongbacteria bacterium]|nr:MAG: hypothetical protein A2Y39_02450 [Candidatus Delongbacteria bacterium GWF2_40_14]HAQ61609.1 hypothetical protein [Candidatus Delongbacteria bacterium]